MYTNKHKTSSLLIGMFVMLIACCGNWLVEHQAPALETNDLKASAISNLKAQTHTISSTNHHPSFELHVSDEEKEEEKSDQAKFELYLQGSKQLSSSWHNHAQFQSLKYTNQARAPPVKSLAV